MSTRTGVIVAARMGSSRLPGKVLAPLCGKPLILFLLERLAAARSVDVIVLATSQRAENDPLADAVAATGVPVFRGDEDDVVGRFVTAADHFEMDRVVRVTGDCPLVNGEALDFVIDTCDRAPAFDLGTTKSLFPVGIDFEIYHQATMRRLHETADMTADDREHLTMHMVRQPENFRHLKIHPPTEWVWKGAPFTVDTAEDFDWVGKVAQAGGGSEASIASIVEAAHAINRQNSDDSGR